MAQRAIRYQLHNQLARRRPVSFNFTREPGGPPSMTSLPLWLRLVPFAMLLIAPVLITLRLRRRVLTAQSRGLEASGWFAFTRALGWLATGVWFAWTAGTLLLEPWNEVAATLSWPRLVTVGFRNLMVVVPPAVTLALCEILAFPVAQRVRGLNFKFRDVAIDAFVNRLWLAVPLALIWTGAHDLPFVRARVNDWSAVAGPCYLAAGVLAYLPCSIRQSRMLKRGEAFQPHAMTTGTLRDRAFALAAKAGVELNQVYVYPMAKWKL